MSAPVSRKRFLQISAALLGTPLLGGSLLGCDPAEPAGPTDTGTPGSDTGPRDTGGGTDTGATDGGGGETDAPVSDPDTGTTNACSGDVIVADISNNHDSGPHELEIPVADIVAGVERDYVTGGTTGHCHVVTITAAQFAMLREGGTIRVVSCNNTEHEYALSCAGPVTAGDPAAACGGSDDGRGEGCTGETFTP